MAKSRRMMLLYLGLSLCGLVCVGFAFYQQHYLRVIVKGNDAVAEQRFDIQHYDEAQRYWFANNAMLLFNQGVLAFRARNLPRATEYFRQVQQRATNSALQVQSHYNLGLVMLALDEAERAAEFFKETLRLDPHNTAAKFNLERLYHFVLKRSTDQGEASLKQAPGAPQDKDQGRGGTAGQGRSKPPSGI
jgi:Ca-activated chloride channel homolog